MKRLFLTGFLFFLLSSGVGIAAELPAFPFVFVTGEAEQEVAPDIAKVSFGVVIFDENPDKALSLVGQRSVELMALFARHGIEKKDIVAHEIGKEAVRERKDYIAVRILGYEVTRRMAVTLRKLEGFDPFMTQLIGLKNVTNTRVEFDTTKRKETEADLFRQAAGKAREKADLLAKGFGTEISSVHAISPSSFGFGGIDEEFGMGSAYRGFTGVAPAGAPAREEKKMNLFVPATIKLREAVSAIYRLK